MSGRLSQAVRGESVGGHAVWLLALCLAAAIVSAALWVWLWTPPEGTVLNGKIVLLGDGPRRAFDSTGWFVLLGCLAGATTGLVAGLLTRRNEVLTLVGLLLAAILAAYVMRWLGHTWGPPDPGPIAAASEDLTGLPLALEAPGIVPILALPIGALAGLFTALVLWPHRTPVDATRAQSVATIPQ